MNELIDLNHLAKDTHAANRKWWYDIKTGERLERNKGELLMLIVSELAEAMEGERKDLMDDHLPHRKMAEVEMADAYIRLLDFCGGFDIHIPAYTEKRVEETLLALQDEEGITNKGELLLRVSLVTAHAYLEIRKNINTEENVLDMFLFIFAYCKMFGYDIEGARHEKNAYNLRRKDHSVEERLKDGGKKW